MDRQDWAKKGAGHRQRLRDKFLTLGIEGFPDDEVLELLLTFGTPQRDCKDPARAALKHFGSLAAVFDADADALSVIDGLGPKNVFALHFVQAVARRYLKHRLAQKAYLRSSREVADYLIHTMRDLKKEIFEVIFLDAEHGIITSETMAEGTINVNTVYPREVIRRALALHASALVIAHNHPSGNPVPSEADRGLTFQMYLAAFFMNIRLLDHLIVAGSALPFSFADQGLMEEIKKRATAILAGDPAGTAQCLPHKR